jgi:hypothetical protein
MGLGDVVLDVPRACAITSLVNDDETHSPERHGHGRGT